MSEDRIHGALSRDGDMALGWCWSPNRPDERLHVTLLVDGVSVATGVAARLRSELARADVCDGYHGFSLALPVPLSPLAVIEARERDSGHVFGRIIPSETAEIQAWRRRVEQAYEYASDLQERLPRVWGHMRWAALSSALDVMGAKFGSRSDEGPDHRLPDGLRLTVVTNPVVSLVLDASFGAERILASVLALAPLLRHYRAELVVTDDGRSAASEALTRLPGLVYRFTQRPVGAARANHAAEEARAGVLVFLRAGEVSASGVAALLDHAASQREIIIGGMATATARQAGLGDVVPAISGTATPTGLSLLTPRETFTTLGQLDPMVEDGTDLPALDFALRVRDAGYRIASWAEPVLATVHPSPNAAAARQCFATRQYLTGGSGA